MGYSRGGVAELPPRARRIHRNTVENMQVNGTTSACAENTLPLPTRRFEPWNYLRVRGEYGVARSRSSSLMELPPRARRIRLTYHREPINLGTTSACAENTIPLWLFASESRNYLRVRGEYPGVGPVMPRIMELPPRARRIHGMDSGFDELFGTTSACAENTAASHTVRKTSWNYLRVRGEYIAFNFLQFSSVELPPRARRIPQKG